MRSVLIALLLAGAAGPAFAADNMQFRHRDRDRTESNESRNDARPERPHRNNEARQQDSGGSESSGQQHRRGDRPQQSFGGGSPAVEQGGNNNHNAGDSVRNWRRQQVAETPAADPQHEVQPRVVRPRRGNTDADVHQSGNETARHWRTRDQDGSATAGSIEERNLRRAPGARGGDSDLVQSRRDTPRVFQPAERRISRTPRRGFEPPAPRTVSSRLANPQHRWRSDWRHDRRYDWRDWRRRHRSHFHFGFYYDPFGWDYFRYGIGWRLWPSYYRNSFWLNDPWQYRLPPAYGPYRWVRYFNDALLVNIYTGEVVDVEYNIFW